jgi:hypothetical protein
MRMIMMNEENFLQSAIEHTKEARTFRLYFLSFDESSAVEFTLFVVCRIQVFFINYSLPIKILFRD